MGRGQQTTLLTDGEVNGHERRAGVGQSVATGSFRRCAKNDGWMGIKTECPRRSQPSRLRRRRPGARAFSLRRRLLFNRGDGLQMTEVAGRGTGELVLGNDVRIDSHLEEYPKEGYALEVVELFITDFPD